MNIGKKCVKMLLKCIAFAWAITLAGGTRADEKEITDGVCENLSMQDIPIGDFGEISAPQTPLHINQKYNTTYDEGYWAGDVWMYGHDGLDTEGESDEKGVNDVSAILPGIVVLSKAAALTGGWGESVIIATRANAYSDEILTHHYHHLHAAGMGEDYETTRKFNSCEEVSTGDVIGKEGSTGNSGGSHLHLSVRRWQNTEQLNKAVAKGGHYLFGYGYTFGDDAKMARNLDPEGMIFNTFRDYQWSQGDAPQYAWSLPYVLKMRGRGIEFGLFDGRFGAEVQVAKRDLARWLKIAAKLQNAVPQSATFSDLQLDDPDSVYVERLVRYPQGHAVFDPSRTCQNGAKKFCPDAAVNRAEALKTVIMAFYGDEFIEDYDKNIWTQTYNMAIQLLDIFTDVPALAWYAPYVYFGVNHGLVSQQDLFAPEEPIQKEQMAKWVITGIEHTEGISAIPCGNSPCPLGYYCSSPENICEIIPACVPSEGHDCEVGGGYQPPAQNEPPPSPACAQGYTQCQSDCCENQSEICFEGTACYCAGNFLDCGNGICKDSLTDNLNCGGCGNVCDPNESCTGGFCIPGQNCECSNGACCDGCHYKPDAFTASAAQSCYGNPQGSGSPTLCLEIQKVSGPNFRHRICKQGGSFQNQFTYQLKDNNNFVSFNKLNGQQGITCTGWQNFEVSYIGYGSGNGAGLQAEIISPAGCGQNTCKYKTGTITVTKTCP